METQAIVTSRGHVLCCDVTGSRAVDVPGGDQGLLHAGHPALSVRRPALSGHLHLVDIQRLQTQRHVQRVGATDHLLQAQEPGLSSGVH